MDNLSTSFARWKKEQGHSPGQPIELEAVVIGSGYGGSVAALRLREMGYQVTLLERGCEFKPGDFPSDLSQLPKYVRAPSADGQQVTGRASGLFEFRAGPGVVSLVGNGLGGGSLINAGVTIRPDAEVFAQAPWPAAIRLPAGRRRDDAGEPLPYCSSDQRDGGERDSGKPDLDHWFDLAERMLCTETWTAETDRQHRKIRGFENLAEKIRASAKTGSAEVIATSVTINSEKCNDCGDCVTGCNYEGAKLTLRDTYLRQAKERNARLVHGASVWTIAPVRVGDSDGHDPVTTWHLKVLDTASVSRWPTWETAAVAEGIDVHAGLVVLAAGTFGSTELLQRSQDRGGDSWWIPPEVGSRFSGNGDSLNFVVGDPDPVEAIGAGATDNREPRNNKTRFRVGPTIAREINLRMQSGSSPVSLRHRLTIEDAAVPGAISRLFTELVATGLTTARLDNWRSGPSSRWWQDFYKSRDAGEDGPDPLAASTELAQRSHVVLTMGHDESLGRIVWVPGRDASVPYWENPQALETYRVQDELLKEAAEGLGAEWVPNPAWRLLPQGASQTMSGPAPSSNITTVHPLGGCVMGDDPRTSVVDHLGRLWRSDRPAGDERRVGESGVEWYCHANFFVLDGSIMPTSLGVNPLLTITALAERAMHAHNERDHQCTLTRVPVKLPRFPPGPSFAPGTQFRMSEPPPWEVTMRERLVGCDLPVRGKLRDAFCSRTVDGELDLELRVNDWLGMWESSRHPINRVRGTLRLQDGEGRDNARVATYRVSETFTCEMLALSEYGSKWFPGLHRKVRWFWKIEAWARAGLTWWITRPDIRHALCHPRPGVNESLLEKVLRRGVPGMKQLAHFAERREMYYELELTLDRALSEGPERDRQDFEKHWTRRWLTNLQKNQSPLPEKLTLTGTKHVEYGASWKQLWSYYWKNRRRKKIANPTAAEHLPRLRESFFDQASHLNVSLASTSTCGTLLEGRFLMDFSAMLREPPLLLGPDQPFGARGQFAVGLPPGSPRGGGGDLTGGLLALGAYPGVFSRFLVKTRLADFRLPDYSGVPLPDTATPDQLALKPRPGDYLDTEKLVVPDVRRYVFKVPRGESTSDGIDVNTRERFELVLWRYARPYPKGEQVECGLPEVERNGTWYDKTVHRVKSALLVHAYAQSGYSYTLNTLQENLAGKLYKDGYEVWVLEHRLSTRLPIHEEPVNLDQMAEYDLPVAVRFVLNTLENDFKGRRGVEALENPQLHVFAQCLGSAALAMSLLLGKLHYEKIRAYDSEDPLAPECPMLASIVFSQTHMTCIGQPGTQARTWIPSFIRDALGRATIPLGVRGPVDSLPEAWMDRVFNALPVPEEERCRYTPGVAEDDGATCRRVRFIEAPLFRHCNLSQETHRELPLHFGQANVRTFAHAAKFVEAERLVDEDGLNIYVTEENAHRYGALPMAFLHGKENELFHWQSAVRAAQFMGRLHPDWAELAWTALGSSANQQWDESEIGIKCGDWLVAGYGHYDVLIGEGAPALVYQPVASFFDTIQATKVQGDPKRVHCGVKAVMHLPRVGPMIGPLNFLPKDAGIAGKSKRPRRLEANALEVQVSFMLDDRFSDGKRGSSGPRGTRTWAFVRTRFVDPPGEKQPPPETDKQPHFQTHKLKILSRPASPRRLGSEERYRDGGEGAVAYRFGVGRVKLDLTGWSGEKSLEIQAFSVHECLTRVDGSHVQDLHADLDQGRDLSQGFEGWLLDLHDRTFELMRNLAASRLPIRQTVSRMRLDSERWYFMSGRVSAEAIAAALPEAAGGTPQQCTFLAGTCRYPGFPVDRHRADHAVQRILSEMAPGRRNPDGPRESDPAPQPAFGLLLGDQIYADATAGAVDPLSPTERYAERHRAALSRSTNYHNASADNLFGKARPALGDLLANLPVVMTPDDHEYIDNYPGGAPLVKARDAVRVGEVQGVARAAALDAWRYFQSSSGGVGKLGWKTFESGPVRVLVLDTRSKRDTDNETIFSDAQRARLEQWLADPAAKHRLNIIATGSVVIPGLRPEGDPANPGAPDTFQWSTADREFLLGRLATACRGDDDFRFALLSGDYHVSVVCELKLDDRVVGLSIVAPPVYAPMPYVNARAAAVLTDDQLSMTLVGGTRVTWKTHTLQPAVGTPEEPACVMTGSAIAAITVARPDMTGPYQVTYRAKLADYEADDAVTTVRISTAV